MEQNLSQSFPFLYRSLLNVCSTYMAIFLSVSQEIRVLELQLTVYFYFEYSFPSTYNIHV